MLLTQNQFVKKSRNTCLSFRAFLSDFSYLNHYKNTKKMSTTNKANGTGLPTKDETIETNFTESIQL